MYFCVGGKVCGCKPPPYETMMSYLIYHDDVILDPHTHLVFL